LVGKDLFLYIVQGQGDIDILLNRAWGLETF